VAGFGPLLPEVDWDAFADAGNRMALRIEQGPARFALAEAEGELGAYAAFGPSRDPDAGGAVGEMWTLFVRPRAWRQGLGRALTEYALGELDAAGFREATVWSFADNHRANAFYEAMGFARDGTARRQEVWGRVLEVRYRQALGQAS
jgi:GNAT superfamily N-acetyltransferase